MIAAATTSVLRLIAEKEPVLLAVDDLQWLDRASWAALDFSIRRTPRTRLLATARREEGPGLGDAVIVELRPFDAAVIDRLVRERLGLRLALPMLRRVTDVAGGNPLYALELCRALADAGLDAADAAAALPVPGSLSELLHARLQQLPQRVRRALLAAALAGTPTVELVQAAEAVEADDLDRAVDIGVLEPGFERVRFAHPLYAEALRGGASADERKAVHNRLARLVNDPEERAVHIARGASGPDEQVAQTLVWGAARARGRGAPSAAAELLELAVDLTPRGVGALHARRLDAASAHLAAGDTARADSMLRAAVEAAGPDRNRAEALWRLAWLRSRSSFEEAAKLNLEALRYSEEDLGLLARIHKSLAFDLHQTDADGGERHAEAAVAIAETLPDPQLLAEALAALGRVRHWCRGQIDHALFRRAIALEAAAPDLAVGDRPRLIYAIALLDTDELALAVQLLHELLEDCRRQGEADVTSPIFFLAMAELERGRLSAAWDYASEAALVADQTGRDDNGALALQAQAELLLGRLQAADASASKVLAAVEGDEAGWWGEYAHGVLAELRLHEGDHEAALALVVDQVGPSHPAWFGLVQALAAAGRLDEAAGVLDRVAASPRAAAVGASLRLALGRALVALAAGDPEAALLVAESAVSSAAARPVLRARLLCAVGSARRPLHQRAAARAAFVEAAAALEACGAAVLADDARRELGRVSGRKPTGSRLTATEQQIADLVARGRTNHEVAQALYISPKTVEWNLSKVYRKLHVTSRTELGGEARETPSGLGLSPLNPGKPPDAG